MAAEDWLPDACLEDPWYYDGMGEEDTGYYVPKTYVCKHCKTSGLIWKQVDGKWRLHTAKGTIHTCKKEKK